MLGYAVMQLVEPQTLQDGRSWVRFLMMPLEFFIDIILLSEIQPPFYHKLYIHSYMHFLSNRAIQLA